MYSIRQADSSEIIARFKLGQAFDASAFHDHIGFLDKSTYVVPSVKVSPKNKNIELGLFTATDIPKRAYIGTYFGNTVRSRPIPNFESFPKLIKSIFKPEHSEFIAPDFTYVVWAEGQNSEVGVDGKNNLRFSNHQDLSTANMFVRGFNFYAARDIQYKEELTWPYSKHLDNNLNASFVDLTAIKQHHPEAIHLG